MRGFAVSRRHHAHGARNRSRLARCLPIAVVPLMAGCVASETDELATGSIPAEAVADYSAKERECLERAIFFEANRTSQEGLVAVGTVVMNRVDSDAFPDTICGVVGQKNQFAPGVLTRSLPSDAIPDVKSASGKVLAGERHPALDEAMFFHTAGLTFSYTNMDYQLEAGGNAFYVKR